jgi:hypothetical protein
MSKYISDLAVAEFDRDVKQEYSQMKQLRPTVKVKTGIEGSTVRFQKSAQGMANKKVPQADVSPMNIDYSYVTATMEDWNAPEYTDIFDAPKINFDERSELVSLSAKAVGRREDQIIIDALEAGATTLTVAKTIGSTDGMNTAKFRDAKRLLDYYNVPGDGRTFLMSSEALYDMLGDSDADTFDKNAVKALVQGELSTWLGFRIMTVGYMAEGGLPKATNTRSAFAYHQGSLGYGIGMDMRTEINYIAQKTSWLVNTVFSAGAIAIDAYGMVTISHDEAA